MKASEHQIQVAFVEWLAVSRIPDIELAHATPNGGARNIVVARKLKAEGLKPGVPDWQWPVARGAFIGLAIEFKADGGNPSKEQRERIDALQRAGWCAVLCWDWRAAARTVQGYAGLLQVVYPGFAM